MTQSEVDVVFSITITIHQEKYFGKRIDPLDRDELQRWVAKQLADALNIYTTPVGSCWGIITTKDKYDIYYGF